MVRKLSLLWTVFTRLGMQGAAAYIFKERALRLISSIPGLDTGSRSYKLHTPLCTFPLECRYDSSDREVFAQVFVRKSHKHVESLANVRSIVDCGANVGYTSAYFLTRFPNAKCVAVEPDSSNYAVLERNLKGFGDRAIPIRAAVWSHAVGLKVQRGMYRDGKAWSTQVCESTKGEDSDVHAIDIGTLLGDVGFDTVDILKIDIEGAERVVFSTNTKAWINRVRTIMIELHDAECEAIFGRAIADSGRWSITTDDELTIATSVADD